MHRPELYKTGLIDRTAYHFLSRFLDKGIDSPVISDSVIGRFSFRDYFVHRNFIAGFYNYDVAVADFRTGNINSARLLRMTLAGAGTASNKVRGSVRNQHAGDLISIRYRKRTGRHQHRRRFFVGQLFLNWHVIAKSKERLLALGGDKNLYHIQSFFSSRRNKLRR